MTFPLRPAAISSSPAATSSSTSTATPRSGCSHGSMTSWRRAGTSSSAKSRRSSGPCVLASLLWMPASASSVVHDRRGTDDRDSRQGCRLRRGRDEQTLITIGLGSCVAIILYDARARIGGLAHTLLPNESMARDRSNPAKFPASAVAVLLAEMTRLGADACRVEAKLVGGASMFANLLPAG